MTAINPVTHASGAPPSFTIRLAVMEYLSAQRYTSDTIPLSLGAVITLWKELLKLSRYHSQQHDETACEQGHTDLVRHFDEKNTFSTMTKRVAKNDSLSLSLSLSRKASYELWNRCQLIRSAPMVDLLLDGVDARDKVLDIINAMEEEIERNEFAEGMLEDETLICEAIAANQGYREGLVVCNRIKEIHASFYHIKKRESSLGVYTLANPHLTP
ncbi:uncharacterized protein BDR25DRAFT_350125 [Lindgomyces ingoldianus]|uniref:Uncharacterized protein n=1 Tax=Lindgomyces ingoldianus TaxID=673940 RepID=A0ACB6R947_9PLEO|nr:uncharacterized protein BDR25DRAFT_350125 [Lindgomyces ingoldianus]KAF2475848.1 hypothetical protein BDR25DRAFT_350125 [Lindgomyces ingoldianus]